MAEFAQAPSVVQFDSFIRVYFSCRSLPDDNRQYTSFSAFVDLDKKNIFKILRVADKPVLELGGKGAFDEFGTYPISAIKHQDEIRCYYAGWSRCESVPFNVAIGMGVSHDNGESFEKLGVGPVISYSLNEPFVMSGPKIRFFSGKWYLFYIAGNKWKLVNNVPEPVYKIRSAVSLDGIRWKKTDKDLVLSRIESDEAQASPDVFYRDGKYHMFFCYRHSQNFRGKEFGYRIGYASSEDLTNWKREDDRAGISISEQGWDSEMISYPHVFSVDNEVYMLYLGNEVGRYGFGIAKLEGSLD